MTFTIDTGSAGGGAQGPWLQWFASGSAAKGVAPKTWVIRDKADGEDPTFTPTDAFTRGVVFDLDTLKLGYMGDDGGPGQAPSKVWAPTLSLSAFPRPDDRKKLTGAPFWSEMMSVRCAVSKSEAATWEQSGFSAFEGFSRLAKAISAGYQDGKHPVVVQTGVETIKGKKGQPAQVPILAIKAWVPKPDILKADAPVIETEPAPPPKAAPKPAPQMAAADAEEW
jgi:hypothetical protein